MSLLDSLANAGKAASAVQSAGKLLSEAAPLIAKAKELKSSHPEIYSRIEAVAGKFKTMHPAVSSAAMEIEKAIIAQLPAVTEGCSSVAQGGDTKPLLSKLGVLEGLVSKLGAAK